MSSAAQADDGRLHELAREHPEAFRNIADARDDDLREIMLDVLADVGEGD